MKLKKYFIFLFIIFFSQDAFSDLYPGGPVDIRDVIDDIDDVACKDDYGDCAANFPLVKIEETTYFKLCEIRRFFCGTNKMVIIAAAIFSLGVLVVIGKATWTIVVTVLVGLCVFSTAEYLAINLTTAPPNLGVVYACYCLDSTSLFTQ